MTCRTHLSRDRLEQVVGEVRDTMAWPVRDVLVPEGFSVRTDDARREHVVSWPRPGQTCQPDYLVYLHGLIHARMAEDVHPLLGGSAISPDSDQHLAKMATPMLEAAMDWFVELQVLELCPDRKGKELRSQFDAAHKHLRRPGALSRELAVASSLVLAKGHVFLGLPLCLNGPLAGLVEAFSRTPADKPCIFTLRALTNRLLSQQLLARADLVRAAGRHAWRLSALGAGPF